MSDVQPTVVRVREGQIADSQSWVYAWVTIRNRQVIYVGGTGMAPQLRAWLHLHDSNPEIGRVAARYPTVNIEPIDVLAFPLPVSVSRPVAKAAFINALNKSRLLAHDYAGDAPHAIETPIDAVLMQHIETFVRQIRDYCRDNLNQ